MKGYNYGFLSTDTIDKKKLERVRKTVPEAEYVIDTRIMDEYITKVWDYPGAWYVNFSLPAGFDSVKALK